MSGKKKKKNRTRSRTASARYTMRLIDALQHGAARRCSSAAGPVFFLFFSEQDYNLETGSGTGLFGFQLRSEKSKVACSKSAVLLETGDFEKLQFLEE